MESVLPISSLFHVLFSFLELEIASIQHLQEIHRFNLRFGGVAVASRFCYYGKEFVSVSYTHLTLPTKRIV